jgi:hypothetical protein
MANSIDTTISINLEPLILPRSEWTFEDGRIMHSVPGTWCKVPEGCPQDWHCLVTCPRCKNVMVLHKAVHEISFEGHVTLFADRRASFSCRHKDVGKPPCTLARNLWLDKWSDKPLYACAIEWISKGKVVKKEIHYMHATNHEEAKFHMGPGNYRIVAVGPAVGALVDDKHGDRLSADTMTAPAKARR